MQAMVRHSVNQLPAQKAEQLKMLSKSFPVNLGLSSGAFSAAPLGPPPAAVDAQQLHLPEHGTGNCSFVDGQRFYNFNQLVQALDQCDPDARFVSVPRMLQQIS